MGRNLGTLVTLVRIATGAADEAAARLAVVTLFGQVIVIRAARATCGRLLGGPLDDPDFIPSFKARIAANTDAVLDRLISEQGQSSAMRIWRMETAATTNRAPMSRKAGARRSRSGSGGRCAGSSCTGSSPRSGSGGRS